MNKNIFEIIPLQDRSKAWLEIKSGVKLIFVVSEQRSLFVMVFNFCGETLMKGFLQINNFNVIT